MFDGIIRTLSGVCHMLISLSGLELNGCTYSPEGGVIGVQMGNHIVTKGK